ncbi:sugar phosphate isomerase/epimerase family protein [Cyclobacterium plantarum]|uniref:Sugar phosphate isomerase/epimerase n=1 Tax=Cyclobacterium plantarum TaxID=2716263 RepID=A0ABX0H4D1_9BACT|nr:sugar phosphate isomerase/epimerase family protein [Cyclobacterium plantarum]NHE56352.1 sugar phosphate isomerase/epimerase [Cyclobacterium plantarum]
MSAAPIKDLSKLCVHTITTKPWSLEEAAENYEKAGVKGVSVWRQYLGGRDISAAGDRLRSHGLDIVSLVRGGFFPSVSAKNRDLAIQDNLKAVDEAAALGAPMIVLVCGADPDQSLETSRMQIQEGIEKVLPHAMANGVKLAIEPLHPMYADTRSAVNTLRQANEMAENIDSDYAGIAADVYHLWWDPDLKTELLRCGQKGNLFAFHICDWLSPTVDFLNDRGLMGEGCIDIPKIRGWAEEAGFSGYNEVEIFSDRHWAGDQKEFLDKIVESYYHC